MAAASLEEKSKKRCITKMENSMKLWPVLAAPLFFIACTALPELYKTVDDVATDGVVQVQVDKEAFQNNKDVSIVIEIQDHKKN